MHAFRQPDLEQTIKQEWSMRNLNGSILFSATDLIRFMGCTHAMMLDLMRLRGEGPEPNDDSEDAALLQKQGHAHEAA
jgi:hypothetical protein